MVPAAEPLRALCSHAQPQALRSAAVFCRTVFILLPQKFLADTNPEKINLGGCCRSLLALLPAAVAVHRCRPCGSRCSACCAWASSPAAVNCSLHTEGCVHSHRSAAGWRHTTVQVWVPTAMTAGSPWCSSRCGRRSGAWRAPTSWVSARVTALSEWLLSVGSVLAVVVVLGEAVSSRHRVAAV